MTGDVVLDRCRLVCGGGDAILSSEPHRRRRRQLGVPPSRQLSSEEKGWERLVSESEVGPSSHASPSAADRPTGEI